MHSVRWLGSTLTPTLLSYTVLSLNYKLQTTCDKEVLTAASTSSLQLLCHLSVPAENKVLIHFSHFSPPTPDDKVFQYQ